MSNGAASSSRPSRGGAVPAAASWDTPATLVSTSARRFVAWLLGPAHHHAEPLVWRHRRSLSDFLVCSNVAYTVIGAVYAHKGLPGRGAIVALSGVTSGAYHLSRETIAGARCCCLAHPGHERAQRPPRLLRVASPTFPPAPPRPPAEAPRTPLSVPPPAPSRRAHRPADCRGRLCQHAGAAPLRGASSAACREPAGLSGSVLQIRAAGTTRRAEARRGRLLVAALPVALVHSHGAGAARGRPRAARLSAGGLQRRRALYTGSMRFV